MAKDKGTRNHDDGGHNNGGGSRWLLLLKAMNDGLSLVNPKAKCFEKSGKREGRQASIYQSILKDTQSWIF